MTNALYDKARESWLSGQADWRTSATVKAFLVSINSADGAGNFYTVNLATDQFVNIIPAGARIGPATMAAAPEIPGRTVTNGEAGATDTAFAAVATGRTVTGIVVYQPNGTNEAASRLMAYFDTAGGNPISLPTNGGAITISWPSASPKIFKL